MLRLDDADITILDEDDRPTGDAADVGRLVRRAAAGDGEAWNALVSRFSGLIWTIGRSHGLGAADTAEVSQTTWMRLFEHLDSIQQPERVGAWLATTARREALRILRMRDRQVLVDDDLAFDGDGGVGDPPGTGVLVKERDHLLHQAFARLPARAQVLLTMLSTAPAMSYREVSAALDMPIGSIGPTRARCLDALRHHAVSVGLSAADLV
jgi:RNA polymerase sigma factor (sigma-70 family)